MKGTYLIAESLEHCHRCKKLSKVKVRWNFIKFNQSKKTALCHECVTKEFKLGSQEDI